MKTTSIRLNKEAVERINEIKEQYKLKNQSETVLYIYSFITRYNVDLSKAYNTNSIDQVITNSSTTLSIVEVLKNDVSNITEQQNKGIDRIIKILRVQENTFLRMLSNQSNAIKDILNNDKEEHVIYALEKDILILEKTIKRLEAEKRIEENKLQYEKSNYNKIEKEYQTLKVKHQKLIDVFKKSNFGNKYNASLSKEELNSLK